MSIRKHLHSFFLQTHPDTLARFKPSVEVLRVNQQCLQTVNSIIQATERTPFNLQPSYSLHFYHPNNQGNLKLRTVFLRFPAQRLRRADNPSELILLELSQLVESVSNKKMNQAKKKAEEKNKTELEEKVESLFSNVESDNEGLNDLNDGINVGNFNQSALGERLNLLQAQQQINASSKLNNTIHPFTGVIVNSTFPVSSHRSVIDFIEGGRVLVSELSMIEQILTLREFARVLILNHSKIQISSPVWDRVVIIFSKTTSFQIEDFALNQDENKTDKPSEATREKTSSPNTNNSNKIYLSVDMPYDFCATELKNFMISLKSLLHQLHAREAQQR